MTADHRHRQAATRLLLAIPKSDDRVTLVAAALAAAEAAALAPVLALADEFEELAGRAYDRPDWRARFVADRIRRAAAQGDGQ